MSYDRVNPTFYQTFQPDTPFHPGAEGWTKAPWPTWGDNPNLAGRRRLATDGLGIIAVSGLGAVNLGPVSDAPPSPAAHWMIMAPVAALLGAVAYYTAKGNAAKRPELWGLGAAAATLVVTRRKAA